MDTCTYTCKCIIIIICTGADPGFSEGGGSESGVDIEGGANPSIVSLKQGVWGAQPPRSYGVFNFG